MTDLQPARGTHDLIGEDRRRHSHVADTARRIAATYGFDEWITPIFEDTRVFSRTLGETSDVVMKEMYSFQDRGGDSVTLRPEGGLRLRPGQVEPPRGKSPASGDMGYMKFGVFPADNGCFSITICVPEIEFEAIAATMSALRIVTKFD